MFDRPLSAVTPRVTGSLVLAATLAFAPALSAQTVTDAQVEAALPKLRALAQAMVADNEVPGLAIVVVHDDKVMFLEGFGHRVMGKPDLVDGDTVFQLASMSKPISSTVVASLVGKGLLSWDSKVADLMPSFQLHDAFPTAEVTVRDLFNHRSGLPGTAGNDLEDIGYDRDHVMHQLRLIKPSSSFRAGYAYSNAGITAGALAAAAVTGKDWETVAEEELFTPLGMASTSFRYDAFAGRSNAAALHIPVDGVWTAKIKRDATPQAPAGGASSSARDLGQWMRLELANGALDGTQLIDATALEETHKPLMYRGTHPISGNETFYGLGWNVEFSQDGPVTGHAGAFSVGTRTLVTLWPEADLGISVLANAFPTGVPEALSESFADLVFEGEVTKDHLTPWNHLFDGILGPYVAARAAEFGTPPAHPSPALANDAYTGRYGNAYVGEARVEAEGGALLLFLGPDGKRRLPLTHFDRDLFLYYPDAEMPASPTPLQFTIGADGRAVSMSAASFADNGWDVLTRLP